MGEQFVDTAVHVGGHVLPCMPVSRQTGNLPRINCVNCAKQQNASVGKWWESSWTKASQAPRAPRANMT